MWRSTLLRLPVEIVFPAQPVPNNQGSKLMLVQEPLTTNSSPIGNLSVYQVQRLDLQRHLSSTWK